MTQNQIVLTPPVNLDAFVLTEQTDIHPGEKLLALAKIVPDLEGLLHSGFGKYLHHIADKGCAHVQYSPNGIGRLVITVVTREEHGWEPTKVGICHAQMWNWAKAVCCCEYYRDLDIVNCHPELIVRAPPAPVVSNGSTRAGSPLGSYSRDSGGSPLHSPEVVTPATKGEGPRRTSPTGGTGTGISNTGTDPPAESRGIPLGRAELMSLITRESTFDPELDSSLVPCMSTARLSVILSHPRLSDDICAYAIMVVQKRLRTAADAFQKRSTLNGQTDAAEASARAKAWMSLTMDTLKVWPIEKRMPMAIFLDYLTSLPPRATPGTLSMKQA